MLSEKNIFKLLSKYINDTGQSEIQIDSFNHFINFGLQDIIINDNKIEIEVQDKASIDDLRNEIIKYLDINFKSNENFIKVVKSSAFCSENNEIISDNYKITKGQKIGIIPPIGGG